MSRNATWTEKAFEDWFIANPFLPDEGRVLVLRRQQPLKRMVDLLALDRNGTLILIEGKNERTTREAVGQSLEYLWLANRWSGLEDLRRELEDDFDLDKRFREAFDIELPRVELAKPRIIIVGPGFDVHSTLSARCLQEILGLDCMLLKAIADPGGVAFQLHRYPWPTLNPASEFPIHSFGLYHDGRIFCVLQRTPRLVLWQVAWLEEDGSLRPITHRRTLVQGNRHLSPLDVKEQVDLTDHGTEWGNRRKPDHRARILGRVSARGADPVEGKLWILVRTGPDGTPRYQVRTEKRFQAEWVRLATPQPVDWQALVQAKG